jgi:hypothetical protein
VVLEAAFGAHLPAKIRIEGLPARPWFEMRAYRCTNPAWLHRRFTESGLFARAGIDPCGVESGETLKYLIPFDSLEDRHRAWTLLDADPEWITLRSEGDPVSVSEVTIYRPSTG